MKKDPLFAPEYNMKISELVDGFPPSDEGEEGSNVYVWDETAHKLVSIFKKIFGEWHQLK
jgi:hypothetical protein